MSVSSAVRRAMGPLEVRRIALAVFAALILGAIANFALTPRVHVANSRDRDLETLVPKKFAGWTEQPVASIVLPDPSSERLVNKIYNEVLTRVYTDAAGDRIMLVIAYGGDQSDALQLHRPEVCYAANGYDIGRVYEQHERLGGRGLKLTRVETNNGPMYEPVTYWMRVGDRQVTNNLDRQLAKLSDGLRGRIPDGVLVRVSTRTFGNDPAAQYRVQDRFIGDFLKSLDPATEEMLVGRRAMAASAAKE
jgi:EpsI family protein